MEDERFRIYDLVKAELDDQNATGQSQGRKATFLFSSIVVFLGLAWGPDYSGFARCVFTCGILLFTVSLGAILYPLFPRNHTNVPNPSGVIAMRKRGDKLEDILGHAIARIGEAHRSNGRALARRGIALKFSYVTAYVGFVMVALAWLITNR